jgi:hypothetical protein
MLSPGDQVMIDGQDYTQRCRVVKSERHAGVNFYDMERVATGEYVGKIKWDRITGHYVET